MTAKKLTLQYYINSTNFDPNWYKAWRRLATTYYNLVMSDRPIIKGSLVVPASPDGVPVQSIPNPLMTQQKLMYNHSAHHTQPQIPMSLISPLQSPLKPFQQQQIHCLYAVQAIRCFFKAIQLAEG
jgi:hypothetical protein